VRDTSLTLPLLTGSCHDTKEFADRRRFQCRFSTGARGADRLLASAKGRLASSSDVFRSRMWCGEKEFCVVGAALRSLCSIILISHQVTNRCRSSFTFTNVSVPALAGRHDSEMAINAKSMPFICCASIIFQFYCKKLCNQRRRSSSGLLDEKIATNANIDSAKIQCL